MLLALWAVSCICYIVTWELQWSRMAAGWDVSAKHPDWPMNWALQADTLLSGSTAELLIFQEGTLKLWRSFQTSLSQTVSRVKCLYIMDKMFSVCWQLWHVTCDGIWWIGIMEWCLICCCSGRFDGDGWTGILSQENSRSHAVHYCQSRLRHCTVSFLSCCLHTPVKSVCPFVCLFLCLCVCLVCLSICLCDCLSVCPFPCVSICLSC